MKHDEKLMADCARQDRRYRYEAYKFVQSALEYAQTELMLGEVRPTEPAEWDEMLEESWAAQEGAAAPRQPREARHLTGRELCEATRLLAQREFGVLAPLVLGHWGLHSTSDIGEVVFNMIDIGLFRKSKNDRREDFDDVFDFATAFHYAIPPKL